MQQYTTMVKTPLQLAHKPVYITMQPPELFLVLMVFISGSLERIPPTHQSAASTQTLLVDVNDRIMESGSIDVRSRPRSMSCYDRIEFQKVSKKL